MYCMKMSTEGELHVKLGICKLVGSKLKAYSDPNRSDLVNTQGLGRLYAMRIWRISKGNGVLKNYLRGPRCARAA